MRRRSKGTFWIFAVLTCATAVAALAQPFDPRSFSEMRWRMIGPFRGGRTVAASGVAGQPNVFYIGVNNGGVWKTTDYGHTWTPIFDDQPTGSIGALAVAPSNPDIVYVGSGEGLQRPDLSTGDGMYRSDDGGKTWAHLGLRDGQQIGSIVVDPKNPNRLFVAVLGHPYGPNAERGVFRSEDGGRTFAKVLYRDENTGAIALAFDPANTRTVYAVLWEHRQAPWENGSFAGPGSGLYKSEDGGTTWRPLTRGLPAAAEGLGRIGVTLAASDPRRLYALVDATTLGGLYRSDDAGESWKRINVDPRVWGRGDDFAEVKVDPKNPNVLYIANVASYRSTDAGASFSPLKGAPGGDDYHTVWISPENSQILLLASDQGATISVNGGATWSSWYNQPTAQLYHVITDNQFPYWVYGGQQESGSVAIASRGDRGQITFRDWFPVGVEEYGYVAPDPLDPNVIYGGKATRFDRRTGQTQDISPVLLRSDQYRFLRTMPIVFSPTDPHVLYLAANVLFRTIDGGQSWEVMSPDLTRAEVAIPKNIGVYAESEEARRKHGGVIYSLAPSPKDGGRIWAGTDDGLIHVTKDGGKSWENVTPPELTPWAKVAQLEASHFDVETAYAAINTFRLDDLKPHVYRTRDGGKTWRHIASGIPDGGIVNTVREDPVRRGLLFAGTEQAVYVSFDDGEHWQTLRLNMPATSIRDLVVHGNDVVVGTHGRSFWILDDIAPLRQLDTAVLAKPAYLLAPSAAYRVRRDLDTDTPLPPEEPAGKNPPNGAIIDYILAARPAAPVSIEILDSSGKGIRRFSSADTPRQSEEKFQVADYWARPFRTPSAEPGGHRFVWDLRLSPPDSVEHGYPISAIPGDTPPSPIGPAVLPGTYTVRLTAGADVLAQPLVIRMDPRVHTPQEGLVRQFELETKICDGMRDAYSGLADVKALRKNLAAAARNAPSGPLAEAIAKLDATAAEIEGFGGGGGRRRARRTDLAALNGEFSTVLASVDSADVAPTRAQTDAFGQVRRALDERLRQWSALKSTELSALNAQLRDAGIAPISGTRD